MHRIVILGGGTGGTMLANLLAKKLGRDEAEIVLVTDRAAHTYQPGWLYVPFGRQDAAELQRPLARLLRNDIVLKVDPVERLDTDARTVHLGSGAALTYDTLVIATGANPHPELVPGFEGAVDHFYTEAAALRLQQKLANFAGGRIVIGVGGLPYKCPVAPLEFTFLLDEHLRQRGLRDKTEITYTFPVNAVFSIPSVAALAEPRLRELGIAIETFFNLETVDPVARELTSLEGTTLPYDLAVFVPPHRGARFLWGHPIAEPDGWVPVSRTTLRAERAPGVWAFGDTTALPISKAGSAAHFQGATLVAQIVGAVRGTAIDEEAVAYDGHVMCFMEMGDDRATLIDFDYGRPPAPKAPSMLMHYEKQLFNHAYWFLVPTGVA